MPPPARRSTSRSSGAPGQRRPTLQDVADAVGLAPATVSYALRGERGSEETLRRVREAADDLGYEVDPAARALASGRSGVVGVLCGSTRDIWQQSLAAGLSRALVNRERRAIVADADGDPVREQVLLRTLLQQRPDGLLVAPLDPFAETWEEVARQVPTVSIGERLSRAPSAAAVTFDNGLGFAQVFDHLAGLGHRRIAVVVPQRPSTPDRPAERLVEQEARRGGVVTTLVRVPPATADPADTVAHLTPVLQGPERPTAAFCLSDSLAFAVLRTARTLGLRVPDDLSVVGFEDVEVADLVGPGLTTVEWEGGAVVDTALTQLLAAIDHGAPLESRVVGPRLVVRGSSGPPTTPSNARRSPS